MIYRKADLLKGLPSAAVQEAFCFFTLQLVRFVPPKRKQITVNDSQTTKQITVR